MVLEITKSNPPLEKVEPKFEKGYVKKRAKI